MKKYIMNVLLFASLLVYTGCSKNDGFIDKDYLNLLDGIPVVSVKIDGTGSQAIDLTNLNSFTGKFTVSLNFPDQPAPSKVDVVVRKNGVNTSTKLFKAAVSSFPSTLSITAAQLQTLFGTPIALGDRYDFGVDIYIANGTKYETFPATASGYASGPVNQFNYSQFARFTAICAYDPNIYQGNFVVVSDLWADLSPGDIVPLTKIDATHFSFVYSPASAGGTLINAVPVIVTVDPASNTPSVSLQTVGTGWTYDLTQPVKVQTTASLNNVVSPCAAEVSLNLNWTQGTGSYTGAVLKLKKQ